MEYCKTVRLKDGRECRLRNGTAKDGADALAIFLLTHAETDYLLSYPDESGASVEEEASFLQSRADSPDEIELLAEVGGKVVGLGGIERVGKCEKVRCRAEFGVSVAREFWGLGIGRALLKACVECAKAAGYAQLELAVVAENKSAIALYESAGFVEYGRNPRGFRSRLTGWQELLLMRLELDG